MRHYKERRGCYIGRPDWDHFVVLESKRYRIAHHRMFRSIRRNVAEFEYYFKG